MLKLVLDNEGDEHRLLLHMKQSAGSSLYAQGKKRALDIALPAEVSQRRDGLRAQRAHGSITQTGPAAAALSVARMLELYPSPAEKNAASVMDKLQGTRALRRALVHLQQAVHTFSISAQQEIRRDTQLLPDGSEEVIYDATWPEFDKKLAAVERVLDERAWLDDLKSMDAAAPWHLIEELMQRYSHRFAQARDCLARIHEDKHPGRKLKKQDGKFYKARELQFVALKRENWARLHRFATAIIGGPDSTVLGMHVADNEVLSCGEDYELLRPVRPTMGEYGWACHVHSKLWKQQLARKDTLFTAFAVSWAGPIRARRY